MAIMMRMMSVIARESQEKVGVWRAVCGYIAAIKVMIKENALHEDSQAVCDTVMSNRRFSFTHLGLNTFCLMTIARSHSKTG